jgi:fructose-bisphosphate aldolase class I
MGLEAFRDELAATAAALAAPGTGLLAADESTGTIGKRFDAIGLENSEQNRRAYRTLLATTPGLAEHISGVILYEETLFQDSDPAVAAVVAADAAPEANSGDPQPIVALFQQKGIVPGIKVDQGVESLAGGLAGESWCTGLKGLAERSARYYARGARFAKWRAVLRISGSGCPSELAVRENAWGLARYARTVQEQGLVPIVEPEILMDGDHDIATTASVQEWVLRTVYEALATNGVFLEGSLLKPSMTTAGADPSQRRGGG